MVGDPKTLMELRRIEASIQIKCRSCGAVRMFDLEDLIALRSTPRDWVAFVASRRCYESACDSEDVEVLPVPYGRGKRSGRPLDAELINLALQVLKDAAYRGGDVDLTTDDVRLALRVLYGYIREKPALERFWTAASKCPRHPWEGCHFARSAIATRLIELGYPVWAENRP